MMSVQVVGFPMERLKCWQTDVSDDGQTQKNLNVSFVPPAGDQ